MKTIANKNKPTTIRSTRSRVASFVMFERMKQGACQSTSEHEHATFERSERGSWAALGRKNCRRCKRCAAGSCRSRDERSFPSGTTHAAFSTSSFRRRFRTRHARTRSVATHFTARRAATSAIGIGPHAACPATTRAVLADARRLVRDDVRHVVLAIGC
jgi:hypothetical protein